MMHVLVLASIAASKRDLLCLLRVSLAHLPTCTHVREISAYHHGLCCPLANMVNVPSDATNNLNHPI